MKKALISIVTASAFGAAAGVAHAEPKVMTEAEMDTVVAGATVETKSGQLVWTVTNLTPPEGTNRGGNGKTEKAAPGLLRAAAAGGLVVR